MRYVEWLFLLILSALGTGFANFIGYDVGFFDSLPGLFYFGCYFYAGGGLYEGYSVKVPDCGLLCHYRTDLCLPFISDPHLCD